MLIEEHTKSRSRQSNDNAQVESKNGSIVRKHFGYSHISQRFARVINDFCRDQYAHVRRRFTRRRPERLGASKTKKCSADFLPKCLILLQGYMDSAQVGLTLPVPHPPRHLQKLVRPNGSRSVMQNTP
jgi:hypothetical protein